MPSILTVRIRIVNSYHVKLNLTFWLKNIAFTFLLICTFWRLDALNLNRQKCQVEFGNSAEPSVHSRLRGKASISQSLSIVHTFIVLSFFLPQGSRPLPIEFLSRTQIQNPPLVFGFSKFSKLSSFKRH